MKVGFTGNSTSVVVSGITCNTNPVSAFQSRWADWSQGDVTNYDSKELLKQGGDAQSGQEETASFNAPVTNSTPYPSQYDIKPSAPGLLPRTVTLQINVGRYRGGGIPMTYNIYAYLDETMSHVDTNFVNQGETLVYTSTNKFDVQVSGSKQYDHICGIAYDRKKHIAKINWKGTMWTGTCSVRVPMRGIEETQRPYQAPTMVDTYSSNYRGERRQL